MMNLIAAATFSIGGTALAAGLAEQDSSFQARKAQPFETQPGAKLPVASPAAASAPVSEATPAAIPKPTPHTPVQELQPPPKKLNSINPVKAGSPRSKSLDLRHCLDLETGAAIASCAGE